MNKLSFQTTLSQCIPPFFNICNS
uniref:Uncharacterized protein n=1 Tax=Arundo donax TaxID=35708 RepID=A0A0A9FHJ1_ARUDO